MLRNNGTNFVILYFVAGSAPTKEDYDALNSIETADRAHVVRFRNGLVIENDSIEPCDGVAGPSIPDAYRERYPSVNNSGEWSEAKPKADPARVPIPKGVLEEVGRPETVSVETIPNPDQGGLFGQSPNAFGAFGNGGNS